MKRPLYYLVCAIACTSMVSATMPMAAIAEAIQPPATAEQQPQADATSSNTGKAEDGANTNATADTVEDSTATSTGTSDVNAESDDGTTAATTTSAPSLRAQTNPTPAAISTTSQTTYAHSATATQNGVTFTVSWNDAPAGTATTFHVTQANGSSQAKARMDVPTYWDGGSQESVCDPSRQAWASYHSLGTAGHDFTFDFTSSGTYRIHFYFMDNDRYGPQNDKGIYYLRTTAEVTVNDAARPSVTQIVNNAVAQCRQQTNGSEYDMALWLHDWTLDRLEYDHSLNWCSAESGLTRHQGTRELPAHLLQAPLRSGHRQRPHRRQRPYLERRKDRRQMVPDGPNLGRHQRQLVWGPGPAPCRCACGLLRLPRASARCMHIGPRPQDRARNAGPHAKSRSYRHHRHASICCVGGLRSGYRPCI